MTANSILGRIDHHVLYDGIAVLCVTCSQLVLLRGINLGILLLFVFPPLAAFLLIKRSPVNRVRFFARAFLALIAFGAVVATFPAVLPNLGGVDKRLAAESDRLLAWYAVVYLCFFLCVLPTFFLVGNLRRHWRGQPATLSRFTCYLGLLPMLLLWPALPAIVGARLGLWPLLR